MTLHILPLIRSCNKQLSKQLQIQLNIRYSCQFLSSRVKQVLAVVPPTIWIFQLPNTIYSLSWKQQGTKPQYFTKNKSSRWWETSSYMKVKLHWWWLELMAWILWTYSMEPHLSLLVYMKQKLSINNLILRFSQLQSKKMRMFISIWLLR